MPGSPDKPFEIGSGMKNFSTVQSHKKPSKFHFFLLAESQMNLLNLIKLVTF